MKHYRCGLKSGLNISKKNSACLIKRAAVFFYHYPGHPLTEIASYSPAVNSITHYDRGYTHFDAFCQNFNSEFQFSYVSMVAIIMNLLEYFIVFSIQASKSKLE